MVPYRFLLAALLVPSLSAKVTTAADADGDDKAPTQEVVVVVGAAGNEEYGRMFAEWADRWKQTAQQAGAGFVQVGGAQSEVSDRQQLRTALVERKQAEPERLWVVLLGHGTYDGVAAKFNLRGPDVTAANLAEWLAPADTPTVIVNCASSSGPFVNQLAADNRIVITAAKSGYELNFARFGGYLANAIADPEADLDKDDQVSLLEAYLTACRRVEEFYEGDARLATEHALLDDNGDGRGTPAAWFRGLRATRSAESGAELDGAQAHRIHLVPSDREARMPPELREQRDNLEQQLAELRGQKGAMEETEYFLALETLMLKLARLYRDQ